MANIHGLVSTTRDKYDDIIAPDPSKLYFTSDPGDSYGELYMGTVRIGAGFIWIDANNPRPDVGIPGYFYVDRQVLDMYVWDENIYRWVYFGNAGDTNSVSLNQFLEFRQEIINKFNDIQGQIDTINTDHLYTEARVYFTTDDFVKVPDTYYYAVTIPKDDKTKNLLVKNIYSHLEGTDSYQSIYPDVTETTKQIVLQFTVPVNGFCILS